MVFSKQASIPHCAKIVKCARENSDVSSSVQDFNRLHFEIVTSAAASIPKEVRAYPERGSGPVSQAHLEREARSVDVFFIWTNGWVNNRSARDLRCHPAHNDATVMCVLFWKQTVVHSDKKNDTSFFPKCLGRNLIEYKDLKSYNVSLFIMPPVTKQYITYHYAVKSHWTFRRLESLPTRLF